jgi:O-antigen/teichoic acid export membrane protein
LHFFIALFTSITFFAIFQPFVELWIGKQYLLALSFVFLLALNIYIGAIHEILYYFRSCFGNYESDRIYMILAAVINLSLSITLAPKFGVSGIMIGTDIGLLFIWYGRMKVFFNQYLKSTSKMYIIKHISWITLAGLEGLLTYWIASYIPASLVGLIGKLCICILIPNCINLLIFARTRNFLLIRQYLNQIYNILKKRI